MSPVILRNDWMTFILQCDHKIFKRLAAIKELSKKRCTLVKMKSYQKFSVDSAGGFRNISENKRLGHFLPSFEKETLNRKFCQHQENSKIILFAQGKFCAL